MSSKQYRVICTKERFKDEIIIDIVPSDGVIHDMLLAGRQKENPKLENYAGSVYLTEIDGQEPEIVFGKFNLAERQKNPPARKTPMYLYYESLAKELTPQILQTFYKMKANGKESTIDINMTDYLISKQKDIEAKDVQSENLKEYAERRSKIEKYKKETLERKAHENATHRPEVLLAWKQALYHGD